MVNIRGQACFTTIYMENVLSAILQYLPIAFIIFQDYDPMAKHKVPRITDRQGPYQQRQLNQALSPDRHDPFAYGAFKHCVLVVALNQSKV